MSAGEPREHGSTRLVVRCDNCHQRFWRDLPPRDPRLIDNDPRQLLELIELLWHHERSEHQPVGRESGL